MIEWAQQFMERMGYMGIVVLMFVENVFPPIPSEVVMPFAGFTASRGQLLIWGVCIAGTLGSVLGALPLYYLGKVVGVDRIRTAAERWGKWLTVQGKEIDHAMDFFHRRGGAAVFLGRLVPGVRSLISIPAGAAGMPLPKFLLYTTAGSAIWASALAYAGFMLGEHWDRAEKWIKPVGWVVTFAIIAWIAVRLWRRRSAASPEAQPG